VTCDNKTSPKSRKAWLDDCRTPRNFADENEVASTDHFKDHRPTIGKSSDYNQGIIVYDREEALKNKKRKLGWALMSGCG
jgi:hypothetical protein